MTNKQRGWENRLIAYIGGCAKSPFRPGRLDCSLFAGGAVKAMTGEDYTKDFRGKYKKIETGQKLLKSKGFNDHIEYVASIFEEHPSPLFARRGDIAVVTDMNGFPALGIVQGENIYVMELNGIGLRPLTEAKRAFIV